MEGLRKIFECRYYLKKSLESNRWIIFLEGRNDRPLMSFKEVLIT